MADAIINAMGYTNPEAQVGRYNRFKNWLSLDSGDTAYREDPSFDKELYQRHGKRMLRWCIGLGACIVVPVTVIAVVNPQDEPKQETRTELIVTNVAVAAMLAGGATSLYGAGKNWAARLDMVCAAFDAEEARTNNLPQSVPKQTDY